MRYEQVYLDNISSAPTPQEVCDTMMKYYIEHFGNPCAMHQFGQWSRAALAVCAEQSAKFVGATKNTVRFTIGFHLPEVNQGKILISPIECDVITRSIERRRGVSVKEFRMSGYKYDVDAIACALQEDDFCLVVASGADRITGTVQPIAQLAEVCHKHNVPLLCDVSPLIGRFPFSFDELGADFGFIEGRVFGAPCNAIVGEETDTLFPLPLAAGMQKSLEMIHDELDDRIKILSELSSYFWELLQMHLPHLQLIGEEPSVAGLLAIAIEDVDRSAMMLALDMQGVAIWAGDSFSEPMKKLRAMSVPDEIAESVIRFSMWHNNTKEELDYVLRVLPPLVDRVRFEKKSPKFRA